MRTTGVLTSDQVLGESWIQVSNLTPMVIVNAALGTHFRVLLVQNSTLSVIGGTSGRRVLLRVEQDSVGGRTLASDGTLDTDLGVSTTAGAVTFTDLIWDEGTSVWERISFGTYQPLNATLTSIATLGGATDRTIYTSGVDTWTMTGLPAFGRSLIDDVDANTARGTLGLGSMATQNQIAAQTDFTWSDGATLVSDLNTFLAKMRTSGALA